MARGLHQNPTFSDRFLSHMLTRNIRIEEDLIDRLFNSSEKRLARALLLLARYGEQNRPQHVLPTLSQELLAEMVGTTRSRVKTIDSISGVARLTDEALSDSGREVDGRGLPADCRSLTTGRIHR